VSLSDRGAFALPDDALQALCQLTSGSFPTGAFSHSYGLETFVQEGRVRDVQTFGDWLAVHLTHAAAPTDGAAVALVNRAVTAGDWDAVTRIDALLTALKLAPEIRTASVTTGRAALRAAREIFPGPPVESYARLLERQDALGNLAGVFGCVTASLKIAPPASTLAFLWSAASSLTSVATRLVPLGAVAAQRCLRELGGCIRDAATAADALGEHELHASAVAQDIAALRHARLYSRLCIS
jgi:urease accessory protein